MIEQDPARLKEVFGYQSIEEILFDHSVIHVPPKEGNEKQLVEALTAYVEEQERLARIDELEKVYGDGTMLHYKAVDFIKKRLHELQKEQQ